MSRSNFVNSSNDLVNREQAVVDLLTFYTICIHSYPPGPHFATLCGKLEYTRRRGLGNVTRSYTVKFSYSQKAIKNVLDTVRNFMRVHARRRLLGRKGVFYFSFLFSLVGVHWAQERLKHAATGQLQRLKYSLIMVVIVIMCLCVRVYVYDIVYVCVSV